MRAWTLDRFGTDGLRLAELPDPVAGPGEVVVEVRAVSLNYRDLLMIRGEYDPRQPLPLVPGSDAAGVVVEVGHGVTRLRVGDRVCPTFHQAWRSGPLTEAVRRATLGGPLPGTFRERMAVPEDGVVRIPRDLTFAEAATLPCAGVTAWRALDGVKPGDVVLALGTGGVSLFVVQLAKLRGATVIVTSSSEAKLGRARALGADHGIRYDLDPDWGKAAAGLAGGVDVVVETGGAGTLEQSLRAVKTGGTIVLLGVLAGGRTDLTLARVFMRGIRVQGVLVGSRDDHVDLCRALAANPGTRPVVDRELPFEQLPRALADLAAGHHFGKLVLTVGDPRTGAE